jgi:hypothetical protein
MESVQDSEYIQLITEFNEEYLESKLFDCVASLNSIIEPAKIVDSQQAYEDIASLFSLCGLAIFKTIDNVYNRLKKQNFNVFLADLLIYLSNKLTLNPNEFNFLEARELAPHFYAYKTSSLNERKIHILCYLIRLMNFMLPNSIDFAIYFTEKNKLNGLVNLLKSQSFIDYLAENNSAVLGSIIYDLNWISKSSLNCKESWHELDAINLLFSFNQKVNRFKIFVYMIISNVAYDKEIETNKEMQDCVDEFVTLACDCINDEYSETTKLEFFDEETQTKQEFDVIYYLDRNNNVTASITGILLSLYRLSINDKIKWDFYQKPGLIAALRKLLFSGNDVEKEYVLQLITQLSFDKNVKNSLAQDTEMVDYVSNLLKSNNFTYKKLAKTCENFLWIIKAKQEETKKPTPQKSSKNLMISYNSGTRDLCLQIRDELIKAGYNVWIDVNEIHGSSLDSMAKAVENAEIVLMCVTEKYRQSINCQSEAQYSFRLQKKIIPLIMQKGYHNVDGWLGFIIGDKIFIDFTKYELNDCFKRLLNQIQLLNDEQITEKMVAVAHPSKSMSAAVVEHSASVNQNQIQLIVPDNLIKMFSSCKIGTEFKEDILQWNETQTEEWFKEKSIQDSILNSLQPINGKILYQLYQLQLYTPEFFYKSITSNQDINLKHVAYFCSCLNDIFKA